MRRFIDCLVRFWCFDSTGLKKRLLGFLVIIVLVVGGLGGSLFESYRWLSHSTYFQVTEIIVNGCRHVTHDEVLALAGVGVQDNLLGLNVDRVENRIVANPWIEKAKVTKDWPGSLKIVVKERCPVVFLNKNDGLYYVDKNSDVFAAVGLNDDLDFPTLTGLEGRDLKGGDALLVEALSSVLKFIHYAGRGSSFLLRQNISEFHVDKDGDFTLFLTDNPFPIYLGSEVTRAKYDRLARVLRWLYKKREFDDVAYIRLDYANKKVLVGKKAAKDG